MRSDPLAGPLDSHHDALVGVRTADERVLLEPVRIRQPALLRRQQGQHGLERVHAEVLALGDPDSVRLGHLEVVADLEPADRAPFDPLDRHAQVVEPHLRHVMVSI